MTPTNLTPHEIKVIDLLVTDTIAASTLKCIKESPQIIDFYTTGNGYFLTIKHSELPAERFAFHEPMIIGKNKNIESTFIIFVENYELTIECAGMSEEPLPEDYRDWDIKLTTFKQS